METKRFDVTVRIRASFAVLAAVIILTCAFSPFITAFASRDYAAIKGFNVDNMTYLGDLNTSLVNVVGENGKMSLWSARYLAVSERDDIAYITSFVEAQIYASGGTYGNGEMNITVTHLGAPCDIVMYTPEQEGSGTTGTVSMGWTATANVNGINCGYTYNNSHTYSDMNLTVAQSRDDSARNRTSVNFCFEFNDDGRNNNISPYKGTIIQRMAVTFAVANWSDGIYDTDYNTSEVTYKATIFGPEIFFMPIRYTKTIVHTISDRKTEADTQSLGNSEVMTSVEVY